ncbi:MAG: rhodanese-like domain-containing protein [Verrucomicrobiales bacterium]|nr:rhodanese-like domain-containing protein [Verrucomicrobiales bacterium]
MQTAEMTNKDEMTGASEELAVGVIGANEARELLAGDQCQLVDVREPVEFAEERVEGAISMPLGTVAKRCMELDRSQPVVVMCLAGKRGEAGAKRLLAAGFTDVKNLEGGINGWKAAGCAVKREERKGLPLMRQVQLVIGVGVLTGSLLAYFVDVRWALLAAFFGAGLTVAGATGWCGLAILMSKMPWNRVEGCGDGG